MKRYKLKGNTLDVDDAGMKGKLAYHFYLALYPNDSDWNAASDDIKMVMKGLAEIAYEQLEKHMMSPVQPSTSEPVANT